MARKAAVRALPQDSLLCGWCEEFEARAKKAEGKLAEAETYAKRLEELVELACDFVTDALVEKTTDREAMVRLMNALPSDPFWRKYEYASVHDGCASDVDQSPDGR